VTEVARLALTYLALHTNTLFDHPTATCLRGVTVVLLNSRLSAVPKLGGGGGGEGGAGGVEGHRDGGAEGGAGGAGGGEELQRPQYAQVLTGGAGDAGDGGSVSGGGQVLGQAQGGSAFPPADASQARPRGVSRNISEGAFGAFAVGGGCQEVYVATSFALRGQNVVRVGGNGGEGMARGIGGGGQGCDDAVGVTEVRGDGLALGGHETLRSVALGQPICTGVWVAGFVPEKWCIFYLCMTASFPRSLPLCVSRASSVFYLCMTASVLVALFCWAPFLLSEENWKTNSS